jgi:signal peptidase I
MVLALQGSMDGCMTGNRRASSIVRRLANRHAWKSHAPSMVLLSDAASNAGVVLPEQPASSQVLYGVVLRVKEFAVVCFFTLGAAVISRAALLESFFVPSTSMAPTLQNRDHIVVAKLAYGLELPFLQRRVLTWDSPSRGEVVVFHRKDDPSTPTDESARSMVKRVIGVEGDTVSLEGTKVVVNGESLKEPYAYWSKGGASRPQGFTVPPGSVFVLGDNRDESFDSRFWRNPFVEVARVIGPVAAVY